MLKKYLFRTLYISLWWVIFSPFNVFAGTLTNINIESTSYISNATATYTVEFTTENTVPSGSFSAFYMTMNYSLGGNNYNFDNVENGDVTLTINGVNRSINSVVAGNNVIHIYPSGSIPA
jgi:hypothetical protein